MVLVQVLIKQNKFMQAMKWQAELYELEKYQDPGDYAPGSIDFLINLAGLYTEKGYFEEATETLRSVETLVNEISNLPASSKGLLLRTQASLGILSFKELTALDVFTQNDLPGKDPKSDALRAVDFTRKEFGPRHPDFISSLRDLAQAYLLKNEKNKALETATEAFSCSELVFGAAHAETGKSMVSLADIHFESGQLDSAESLYTKAVKIFQKRNINNIDHARAVSRLAAICRITGRDSEVNKFETMLGNLQKDFAVKLGSLNIGQYDARIASPSARLTSSVEPVFWRLMKKIMAFVSSLIDKIGVNFAKIIVSLLSVGLSTGMALFVFGPHARFLSAHGDPGLLKMITFGVGHSCLVLSWMVGYTNFFEAILGNPRDGTSLHFLGKSLAYLAYAACFFLLRDYLHLIPQGATSVVVMILGLLILIPSLIGLLSHKSASKLLERIGLWLLPRIFILLPKAALISFALSKIGPRASSLSKAELVDVLFGNKEVTPLNTSIELPEGLLVYESFNPHIIANSPLSQAMDSKHYSDLWLAAPAGLIAPILMLLPRLCELLPDGVRPEGKTVQGYAILVTIQLYVFIGYKMGRRLIALMKTLTIVVIIAILATLTHL